MNQPTKQLQLPQDLGSIKMKIDTIMVSVNDTYTSLLKAFVQVEGENKKLKEDIVNLRSELQTRMINNSKGDGVTLSQLEATTN